MVNENDYLIKTDIKREKGDIKIYIKSCLEFEDYLKATRKTTKTDNFCNTTEKKEFYDVRNDGLTDTPEYDSAIRDLITNNKLNFAVLRLKNISDGVEIKLNRLISIDDLNLILRNFIKDFIKFYRDYIKDFEVNCLITNKNIIL